MTALLGCCLIGARVEAATTASTTYQGQASIVVITDSTSIPEARSCSATRDRSQHRRFLEQTISDVNVANGGLVISMARASTTGRDRRRRRIPP